MQSFFLCNKAKIVYAQREEYRIKSDHSISSNAIYSQTPSGCQSYPAEAPADRTYVDQILRYGGHK